MARPRTPTRSDLLPQDAEAHAATGAAARTPILPPAVRWGLAVLCAVLAFALYAPVLGHDFVDWDDTGVLLETEGWRGLGAEQLGWMFTTNHYGHYQPVTWLTYGLDYVLWGTGEDGALEARGFHFTNHVFHALNALMVFLLSLTLLRRAFARAMPPAWTLAAAATFSALFFALHPLRVESVAWVTERRDLVSACFLLTTVLAYLRYVDAEGRARWTWYGAMLALYVVSMLSKVGGAPLPIILLVLDWFPLRRVGLAPSSWWTKAGAMLLVEKLPMLVLAFAFSIATIGQQAGVWLIPLEQHPIDARIGQAFYGLAFYPWKTVAPAGLLPLYELQFPFDPLQPKVLIAAVAVVATGILAVLWWRRLPGLLAAILVYGLMVGPLLGFFQNGPQIVADRYSYLSTLGFGLLLAAAVARGLERAGSDSTRRALVAACAIVPLVITSFLTVRQAAAWRDSETFWASMHQADPDSSFAANGQGVQFLEQGRAAEAVELFERAIDLMPTNREAYFNLWRALEAAGEQRRLLPTYRAHVDAPFPEVRAEAAFRLARATQQARRYDEAIDLFLTALRSIDAIAAGGGDPTPFRARATTSWTNIAIMHYSGGRRDQAAEAARQAIAIDPGRQRPYVVLADVAIDAGDLDGAARFLAAARERGGTTPQVERVQGRLRNAGG